MTLSHDTVGDRPQRYRLPHVEQLGYAQLSLIETALSPLDFRKTTDKKFFTTHFQYTDEAGERQTAEVRVGCAFEALLPNDDYILWSLLSLTLRHSQNHVLTATPYWLLKSLGMTTGGDQYLILRRAVERLASVVYHNSGFYNPVTQIHERFTLAFFASHLPTSLDSDRLWRFRWNEEFIAACRATGGRMMFDLEMFRRLGSPATRRLFLKLADRFWRSSRVHLDVNDLTINGLGYSPTVPLKVRKQKLSRCIATLLAHDLIKLGNGHTTAQDLYLKRGKGSYVVLFFRGPYFEQPYVTPPTTSALTNDPLYEPIKEIGVTDLVIAKLFLQCSRGILERWLRITEAALKDKPAGFPGFKVSPTAFFVDGALNQRMPPDWMYQFEKVARQKARAAEVAKFEAREQLLHAEYAEVRRESLTAFINTDHGRGLYDIAYRARLALNTARSSNHSRGTLRPRRSDRMGRSAGRIQLPRVPRLVCRSSGRIGLLVASTYRQGRYLSCSEDIVSRVTDYRQSRYLFRMPVLGNPLPDSQNRIRDSSYKECYKDDCLISKAAAAAALPEKEFKTHS